MFYEFTELANGTPIPPSLILENGTFGIAFGQLAPTGIFPDPFWICTQESSADANVFATHKINPNGGGLILRCVDKDNMIICAHNSNGTITISERVSGVDTIIATAVASFNPVRQYAYLASCKGNLITFSVQGMEQVSASTTFNINATKHGIRMTSTAGVGIFRMQIPDATDDVFKVATIGQSNISGRGVNPQVYTGSVNANLFTNGYEYKGLEDPYDSSVPQTDAISADSFPAGSWLPKFCTDWSVGRSQDIVIIPCPLGGTVVSRWQKFDINRIDGLNLYESMIKRITAIGGVDIVFLEIGESDSEDIYSTSATDYAADLKQLASDIFNDTGTKTFIIPLHTITQAGFDGDGITTGQTAIRAAQLTAASESNFLYVAPTVLTDINISVEANVVNDGLHFKTDADLTTVGFRTYVDFEDYLENFITSTLNLNIVGIPDGDYSTVLDDENGNRLFRGIQTYTNSTSNVPLAVAVGTTIKGYVDDNTNPSTNGAYIEGVTE